MLIVWWPPFRLAFGGVHHTVDPATPRECAKKGCVRVDARWFECVVSVLSCGTGKRGRWLEVLNLPFPLFSFLLRAENNAYLFNHALTSVSKVLFSLISISLRGGEGVAGERREKVQLKKEGNREK